jgi:hypothetical protein
MNKKISPAFTTIELLVASSIMIVLGLGVMSLQYFITTSQLSAVNSYINIDYANSTISKISREIRVMRTSENGAFPLDTAADNELIFYSDIDYDGDAERVRYTLSGSEITKGIIEPVGTPADYPEVNEQFTTIAENINNYGEPLFTYYNENWPSDVAANPLPEYLRLSETRLIRIYVNLNTNPNFENQEYILESNILVRSLKSNY